MKKALEAGIKHCSLFEKYLTHLPEMVDFYYKQKTILQVMLAALDAPEDEKVGPSPITYGSICCSGYPNCIHQLQNTSSTYEPKKPEPQGSVDWYELERIINSEEEFEGDMPEENYKLYTKVGMTTALRTSVKVTKRNIIKLIKDNQDLWLKTKPAIDPEIKRVYDHWKKNDGIVVIERAFERDMWNCIKAHCERGE
jgi:hypothetical protein